MKAIRKMRLMRDDEKISLLPDRAGDGIDGPMIMTGDHLPENIYADEIKKGTWKCCDVFSAASPLYRVVYQLNGRILSIVAAVGRDAAQADISILGTGLEQLAHDNLCDEIFFSTNRRSLVEQCKRWGASVKSVNMSKKL